MHSSVYGVFYSQFSHQQVLAAFLDLINAQMMESIKFITMFTRSCQLTLSLKSTPNHSVSLRYILIILIQLCHDLGSLFLSGFPPKTLCFIFRLRKYSYWLEADATFSYVTKHKHCSFNSKSIAHLFWNNCISDQDWINSTQVISFW